MLGTACHATSNVRRAHALDLEIYFIRDFGFGDIRLLLMYKIYKITSQFIFT